MDIVERLRDRQDAAGWLGDGMKIRKEAADEIERLREQLAAIHAAMKETK